jgi:hypothetical protein
MMNHKGHYDYETWNGARQAQVARDEGVPWPHERKGLQGMPCIRVNRFIPIERLLTGESMHAHIKFAHVAHTCVH